MGDARARVGERVITIELAHKFAEVLASDVTHTVESAALAVGLRPGGVRQALYRFNEGECKTEEDAAVCEVLAQAKADHIRKIRGQGFDASGKNNAAGTSWTRWQLEVQDPLNHPRKALEVTGPGGKPIAVGVQAMTTDELLNVIHSTEEQ